MKPVDRSTDSALDLGRYVQWPNPGFRAYLGRVAKGQDQVYTAPFGKGEDITHILEQWVDVLSSISESWPGLFKFELDMKSKVGPLSIMKPLSQRLDDIQAYYDGILLPKQPVMNAAVSAVLSEWRHAGIVGQHIYSQEQSLLRMKLSTNSGTPYFRKRRTVVTETFPVSGTKIVFPEVYQDLGKAVNNWRMAAILGWRGQEGGSKEEDVKQRVVWMFPFSVNILESLVYQPLIAAAQRSNLVPSWVSMESVDKCITNMFDSKGDALVICTDFTKFDQHFNESLQDASRTIIEGILSPDSSSKAWLEGVYPIKYMIPLIISEKEIRRGYHGMASGSGGTNFDETLAHRALQYEAAMKSQTRLNPYSQCLGDDGVLTFPGISVDKVIDSYSSHGLEMNESKQDVSYDECIYLRRWHHKAYRPSGYCAGVYSTCRALGRLKYMERYMDPEVWGPKAVALRQLSILNNVEWHPLREEFIKFCMKRDRYRLGLDIPHFLDDISSIKEEMIDYMPDFLGYVQSNMVLTGIDKWWIVKYLKSMQS